MNKFEQVKKIDDECHFKIYKRVPVLLEKGKGSRLIDSEGKEYIDMLAGIAVNSLGHCHPNVVNAIKEQTEKLIHCTNLYYTEPQAKLADLLIEHSDMDRILFCNSGTEAVEGAMKLARKWASKNHRGGEIISMDGSFHGRSLAALTATGQNQYKKGFDPLPHGFKIIPFNDLDAVKNAISEDTCAVMIEPVQGEGGIKTADGDYLRLLRNLCDDNGILLIFDEIQCGLCRTGHLFAYQGYEVVPDIITIAKALGGGFPIGALMAKEKIADAFEWGDHGTTFGGNPLATAAALATINTMIQEELPKRSNEMGQYMMNLLKNRTKDINAVKEIRGRGLMIGVVLDRECKDVVKAMFENGVLCNCTAKNVVRFVPPLNIPVQDLDRAVDIFIQCLNEVYPNE
jgi:predicted acetylornithine/succinylornithine family transaminase